MVTRGDRAGRMKDHLYLAQIRSKLEPDPARPRYFITEARRGYRFEPEQTPASEIPQ